VAIDESNYERIHEQAGAIALQVDSFTPAHSPFGMPIDVASLPAGSIQRVCRDAPSVACPFSFGDVERVGRP
jgi:hypothetical protein